MALNLLKSKLLNTNANGTAGSTCAGSDQPAAN